MAGEAVFKPKLVPQVSGWSVYDSEGKLREWHLDFRSACDVARQLWRYERKPPCGAEQIWRANTINDWRFFGDVS